MGCFFFSGLGIMTSPGPTSTHLLQPMQISGLNSTALLGVGGLGTIYALSLMSVSPLINSLLTAVLLIVFLVGGGVRGFEVEVQRQVSDLDLVILLADRQQLVPLRRGHRRGVESMGIEDGGGGVALQGRFEDQFPHGDEGIAFQQSPQLMGVGGISRCQLGGLKLI